MKTTRPSLDRDDPVLALVEAAAGRDDRELVEVVLVPGDRRIVMGDEDRHRGVPLEVATAGFAAHWRRDVTGGGAPGIWPGAPRRMRPRRSTSPTVEIAAGRADLVITSSPRRRRRGPPPEPRPRRYPDRPGMGRPAGRGRFAAPRASVARRSGYASWRSRFASRTSPRSWASRSASVSTSSARAKVSWSVMTERIMAGIFGSMLWHWSSM